MGIYKCSNCGYESNKYFGLCFKCHEGEGEFVEGVEVRSSASKNSANSPKPTFRKISKDIKQDIIVFKTQFESFNRIISSQSGFVQQQVVAIASQPGIGKSTLLTQISKENALYISTEESYSQVNSRFLRVNPKSEAEIMSETNIDTIIEAIASTSKNLVIIDSLNSINNGMDGYIRSAQNMSRIVQELKSNNKVGIIVSQVTKKGEIVGMNTIMHVVDTVLYLERSELNNNLILSSNKNRFGEIGSISLFEHCNNGLREIVEDKDLSLQEVGACYSNAKFGYRSVNVRVEALVAQSNMMNGLRKTYGINPSRMQQIVGILDYNSSKLDFSSKDIYVAISSGISVSDSSIDLAIANSILSSYYKTENKFKDFVHGEMSLNGNVKNGNVGHIKELIKMYEVK